MQSYTILLKELALYELALYKVSEKSKHIDIEYTNANKNRTVSFIFLIHKKINTKEMLCPSRGELRSHCLINIPNS